MLILHSFCLSGPTLRSYLSLIVLLLVFSGNAQPVQSLNQCFPSSPTDALIGGTSLCAENGEFEPDFIIGTSPGSVTYVSTLTNTQSWFGNKAYFYKKLEINGRLILDKPLMFYQCTVKMGPAAEIVSLNNNSLIGRGSDFFACNVMWNGMTAEQEGRIVLFGCHVEDAINAITIEETSRLGLIGNTFNRNIVGVRNTNAGIGVSALQIGQFRQNTFTTTSTLNNGQLFGTAGMQLSGCVADLGDVSWPNTFTNLRTGILAQSCVLSVTNATFQNMVYDQGIGLGTGVGIYSNDGTLSVQGSVNPVTGATQGGSTFEDCGEAGILAAGANLNIARNTFNNNVAGVYSYDNFYAEEVHILDNDFVIDAVDNALGIVVLRSIASGNYAHNVIRDNHITFTRGSALGIAVNSPFHAIDEMEIIDNYIIATEEFTDYTFTGISVEGGTSDNFLINDNTIDLPLHLWCV